MFNRILSAAFILITFTLFSCKSGSESAGSLPDGVHKVMIQEVLQASEYTYLKVKENGKDIWLALPTFAAKQGETYYYKNGTVMNNFESKELKRTFESVVLLGNLSKDLAGVDAKPQPAESKTAQPKISDSLVPAPPGEEGYQRKAPVIEKKTVKVEHATGGITISELFAKKDTYSGKTVKISGEVTKFTPSVMNKNWIHIQDGTDHNGKYDLTVTSDAEVAVGDKVVLEGKISLNKDLGYGYFFEVLMEEATLKK